MSESRRHFGAACRSCVFVADLWCLEFLGFELVDRIVPYVGRYGHRALELQGLPKDV